MSNIDNSRENNRENKIAVNPGVDFLSNSYVQSNPTLLESQLKELTTRKGYTDPEVLKLQIELLSLKLEKNLIARADFYNEFYTIEKRLERVVNNIPVWQVLQLNVEKTSIAINAYPKFFNKDQASISFLSYISYLNDAFDKVHKLDRSEILSIGNNFFNLAKNYAEKGIKGDACFSIATRIYKLMLDHDVSVASFLFGEYKLVLNKLDNAQELLQRADRYSKNQKDFPKEAFLTLRISSKLSLLYVMQADDVPSMKDKEFYIDKSEELAFDTMLKIKQFNSDIESLSDELLDLYNESCSNLIKGYLVLGKLELASTVASNSTFQKSKYYHVVQELLNNYKFE
jgi:hypothetical protein